MKDKEKIAEQLKQSRSQIARDVVERMFRDDPETWEQYGAEGKKISIRDMEYHLPYLEEAILSDDPSIFMEYVEWTQKFFTGRSRPKNVLHKTFNHLEREVQSSFNEEQFEVVKSIFEHATEALRQPLSDKPSGFITSKNPYFELAEAFHKDLLKGNRNAARKRIIEEHQGSVKVESEIEKGTVFIINLPLHFDTKESPGKSENHKNT